MTDYRSIDVAFQTILDLINKEKTAISTFEYRIGMIRNIKKNFRKIYSKIDKLDRYDNLLDDISRQKQILRKFQDALLISEKNEPLESSEAIIDHEIMEEYNLYKDSINMQKILDHKVIERRLLNLKKIIGAENELREIIRKFQNNIKDFRRIIESQKNKVEKMIEMLDLMEPNIKFHLENKEVSDDVKRYRQFIQIYRRELNRLLSVEKELMHEPITRFLNNTKRTQKLVNRLKKKSVITKEDILRHIDTFSRADEFISYNSAIRHRGILEESPDKENIEDLIRKRIRVAEGLSYTTHYKEKWHKLLALTDLLTKLSNRRNLIKRFNKFIKRNQNNSMVYSILFFDIDDFKGFNSIYGHEIGDMVLATVSSITDKTIKKMTPKGIKEDPIACRYGGEEFVVFLPLFDKKSAYAVAENIRKDIHSRSTDDIMPKINQGNNLDSQINSITISIGISNYPTDTDSKTLNKILRIANMRMKKAKNTGKNRVISS